MAEEQLNLFAGSSPADETSPLVAAGTDLFDRIPTSATVPIPPGTYQDLTQLATHCGLCHRCVLGSTRINPVVGRGAIQAPVMIVGEGPGQNEDEQGLPFVGKSGQLLEKILASVNFSTEREIYICNLSSGTNSPSGSTSYFAHRSHRP
jgi:uracil-DNA glycosylase